MIRVAVTRSSSIWTASLALVVLAQTGVGNAHPLAFESARNSSVVGVGGTGMVGVGGTGIRASIKSLGVGGTGMVGVGGTGIRGVGGTGMRGVGGTGLRVARHR